MFDRCVGLEGENPVILSEIPLLRTIRLLDFTDLTSLSQLTKSPPENEISWNALLASIETFNIVRCGVKRGIMMFYLEICIMQSMTDPTHNYAALMLYINIAVQ